MQNSDDSDVDLRDYYDFELEAQAVQAYYNEWVWEQYHMDMTENPGCWIDDFDINKSGMSGWKRGKCARHLNRKHRRGRCTHLNHIVSPQKTSGRKLNTCVKFDDCRIILDEYVNPDK